MKKRSTKARKELSWIAAVMSALLVAAPLTAKATHHEAHPSISRSDPSVNDAIKHLERRDAKGHELVNGWFALLSTTGNTHGIASSTADELAQSQRIVLPYLDESFQLQRADGTRYDKYNYAPIDIDDFFIKDVISSSPADGVIVTRYWSKTPGSTTQDSLKLLNQDWAPRLTTFRWNPSANKWQIVSHANFNTPIAALCDRAEHKMAPLESKASDHSQKLGISLADQWFLSLQNRTAEAMIHPAAQSQSASGAGYKGRENFIPATIGSFKLSDYHATRNGNLITVTLLMTQKGAFYRNKLLADKPSPRLLTFLLTSAGKWEMIASALFSTLDQKHMDLKCLATNKT